MIDITIQSVCTTCQTSSPLRFVGNGPITLGERSTLDAQIDPDEFQLCATCGNPLRLHIQCQPFELANHLDNPVARGLYEQGKDKQG